jgi:hypothetical protein
MNLRVYLSEAVPPLSEPFVTKAFHFNDDL